MILCAQPDQLAAAMKLSSRLGAAQEPVPRSGFAFAPDLDTCYEAADVVVTHGGLGTVAKCCTGVFAGRCLQPRPLRPPSDQIPLGHGGCRHLLWCRDLADLPQAIETAGQREFLPTLPPQSHIGAVISEFLQTPPARQTAGSFEGSHCWEHPGSGLLPAGDGTNQPCFRRARRSAVLHSRHNTKGSRTVAIRCQVLL